MSIHSDSAMHLTGAGEAIALPASLAHSAKGQERREADVSCQGKRTLAGLLLHASDG
jgi:hypothetical protein